MKYQRYLCILLWLGIVSSLAAQSYTPPIRLNDDAKGSRQGSPQMRVGIDGTIHVVWADHRTNSGGDIYYAKSTDRGVSFSVNRPVYTGGNIPDGMQRGPQIAVDSIGGVHIVWMEFSQKGDAEAYYIGSTDGGVTFSQRQAVSGDSSRHNQDFPTIAADAANRIYIAFVDDREIGNGISSNTQIMVVRSTDRGATFSPAVRASNMPMKLGGSCECCNTSIAVTGSGHLYISFRSNINNRRDVFLARSFDQGANFVTAVAMASEQWVIPACPMSGSTVVLDREETAHVAWRDSRASSAGKDFIYYSTVHLGDSTATPDMAISSTTKKSNFPSLSVTQEGAVICLFQDNSRDANDVMAVASLDGGNTFSLPKNIGDGGGTARQEVVVGVVAPTGERYVVWQDASRDDGDIIFARDTTQLTTSAPSSPTVVAPQGDAKVAAGMVKFIWSPPASLGRALHVRYDVTYERDGIEQKTVTRITPSELTLDLPAGNYRWWLRSTTLTGVSTNSEVAQFSVGTTSSVERRTPTKKPINLH
jgi:hypothetical protein